MVLDPIKNRTSVEIYLAVKENEGFFNGVVRSMPVIPALGGRGSWMSELVVQFLVPHQVTHNCL